MNVELNCRWGISLTGQSGRRIRPFTEGIGPSLRRSTCRCGSKRRCAQEGWNEVSREAVHILCRLTSIGRRMSALTRTNKALIKTLQASLWVCLVFEPTRADVLCIVKSHPAGTSQTLPRCCPVSHARSLSNRASRSIASTSVSKNACPFANSAHLGPLTRRQPAILHHKCEQREVHIEPHTQGGGSNEHAPGQAGSSCLY